MAVSDTQLIFYPKNCLNVKRPYALPCRRCIYLCPHEAISEKTEDTVRKEISSAKCTDCGICMAVCPSDGFVDRNMDDLQTYLFAAGPVILNCPAARPRGHEIACLGMFDQDAWSTLMLLSAEKDVTIITGDCGGCIDRRACALSVGVFKEVLSRWPEQHNVKIEIAPDDDSIAPDDGSIAPDDDSIAPDDDSYVRKAPEKSPRKPSRLRQLRGRRREQLNSGLPALIAEETKPIPRTRTWLLEALRPNPARKIPCQALRVSEECTGCGLCVRICPQEAIRLDRSDGADRLFYKAVFCVRCGRCVESCGSKALTLEYVPLSGAYMEGSILLCAMTPRFCEVCGRQIYHKLEPGLCLTCAAKDPSLKGILY